MSEAQQPGGTILIAEDDDGHAELIELALRAVGLRHAIRRFRDGQEALDFFQSIREAGDDGEGRKYLLLLDIRMPRVSGLRLLERMKADSRLKTIPVIVLTTTDDPREMQKCYEHGCNAYVVKPVTFEQFSMTFRQIALFLSIMQVPNVPLS